MGWGGYDDVLLLCCCFVIHCYRPLVHLAFAHMVDATLDGTCEQTNTCVPHPFVILRADIRVQSATRWTASVHTLHMSTTCDNFCFQNAMRWTASVHTLHMSTTCDNFCFQSASRWTASVYTLHMSKPVITFVFKMLCDGLPRYSLYTCPNL